MLDRSPSSLGATVEEMTWMTTGFVIATVVVMPLTAFLGRFFGQKRVFLFSFRGCSWSDRRCAGSPARCR